MHQLPEAIHGKSARAVTAQGTGKRSPGFILQIATSNLHGDTVTIKYCIILLH